MLSNYKKTNKDKIDAINRIIATKILAVLLVKCGFGDGFLKFKCDIANLMNVAKNNDESKINDKNWFIPKTIKANAMMTI